MTSKEEAIVLSDTEDCSVQDKRRRPGRGGAKADPMPIVKARRLTDAEARRLTDAEGRLVAPSDVVIVRVLTAAEVKAYVEAGVFAEPKTKSPVSLLPSLLLSLRPSRSRLADFAAFASSRCFATRRG